MVIDVPCITIENDLPIVFEHEEDMPDKLTVATLAVRMETVEEALGIRPKKAWWTKGRKFALTIGIAVVAILVAIYAVKRPEWKAEEEALLQSKIKAQVDASFTDHKFTEMAGDVHEIKGQLDVIVPYLATISRQQAGKTASLSLPEFERSLPNLKSTLQVARLTNADVPQPIVQQIQSKLSQANRTQPAFWGAASALINYAYPNPTKQLPDCADTKSTRVTLEEMPATATHFPRQGPFIFRSCRLNLDSSIPLSHFYPPGPDWDVMECDGCQVTYRGGAIPLLQVVGLKRIILKGCTFNVDASNQSPVSGKNLIAAALNDSRVVSFGPSSV